MDNDGNMVTYIYHRNEWDDYCGEADHTSIDDALQCANRGIQHITGNVDLQDHIMIVGLDEYMRLLERTGI